MKIEKKPTAISLFCGAGGCSLGFKNAGYNILYANDKDKQAIETYKKNFNGTLVELEDVDRVDFSNVLKRIGLDKGELDILIGGPPCQGFTSAGARFLDDPRNHLLHSYINALNELRPKWFLMENVEGLLTMDKGKCIANVVNALIDAGYFVRVDKVYSQEYGIPQRRKRVIIIGNRLGYDFSLPKPTVNIGGNIFRNSENSLWMAIKGLPAASVTEAELKYENPLQEGDLMERYFRNKCFFVNDHTYNKPTGIQLERISLLKEGDTMKNLPEHLQHDSFKKRANRRVMDGTPSEKRGGSPSGLKRLNSQEPSLTITSAAIREFIHPKEDRALTIRECARIQTFPDNFQFIGNSAEKIQQIGNAIPPLLAEILGNHINDNYGFVEKNNMGKGRFLGFSLTKASAMSPALKNTDLLLSSIISNSLL